MNFSSKVTILVAIIAIKTYYITRTSIARTMTDPITHMKSLVYEREIEEKRKFYEEIAREDDPTAVAVAVPGGVAYEEWPAVKRVMAEGYRLVDANAFGWDDELAGEILVFSKDF